MSFDDRSLRLDDSPKSRVQERFPQYVCKKANRFGFVITDGVKYLCEDTTAYGAWQTAESILIHEPLRAERKKLKKEV